MERAKFHLCDFPVWDGGRMVHVVLNAEEAEPGLHLLDDDDHDTVLFSHLFTAQNIYRKFDENILVWKDQETHWLYGLRFEEVADFNFFWDKLKKVQERVDIILASGIANFRFEHSVPKLFPDWFHLSNEWEDTKIECRRLCRTSDNKLKKHYLRQLDTMLMDTEQITLDWNLAMPMDFYTVAGLIMGDLDILNDDMSTELSSNISDYLQRVEMIVVDVISTLKERRL